MEIELRWGLAGLGLGLLLGGGLVYLLIRFRIIRLLGNVTGSFVECDQPGNQLLITANAVPGVDETFVHIKVHVHSSAETPSYAAAQHTINVASPNRLPIPYTPRSANKATIFGVFALKASTNNIPCFSSSSSSSSKSSSSLSSAHSSSSQGSSSSSSSRSL